VADEVFLTQTAVLERMSGPLCDAVLELPGSAATCSGTCAWRSWNACSPS
jgi:hypothetical protein